MKEPKQDSRFNHGEYYVRYEDGTTSGCMNMRMAEDISWCRKGSTIHRHPYYRTFSQKLGQKLRKWF